MIDRYSRRAHRWSRPVPAALAAGVLAVGAIPVLAGTAAAAEQAQLQVSSTSVVEGNSGDTPYTISINGRCDVPCTLQFETADGSPGNTHPAHAGEDYYAIPFRTVKSGSSTYNVQFTSRGVIGDTTPESDETFQGLARLVADDDGRTLASAAGTVTIVDDDTPAPVVMNRVRGGGVLTTGGGQKSNLAVDAQVTTTGEASGRVVLQGATTLTSNTITGVTRRGNTATVTGTAKDTNGTTGPFTMTVTDRGSTGDQVSITFGRTTTTGTLTSGNITLA